MTKPVASPHRLVDPDALHEAIGIGAYRHRRIALRRLVQPVLEQMFTTETATQLFARSPLVGKGEKQIFVRPQVSGLRDQLDLPTLTVLAYAGSWLPIVTGLGIDTLVETLKASIELALSDPEGCAMPSADSRTGFVFGRHRLLTPDFVAKCVDNIHAHGLTKPTTPKETSPTMPTPETAPIRYHTLPPGTNLNQIMALIYYVSQQAKVPFASATVSLQAVMELASDEDRFEAAYELITMRGDHPEHVGMSDSTLHAIATSAIGHAEMAVPVPSPLGEEVTSFRPRSIKELAKKLSAEAAVAATLDPVPISVVTGDYTLSATHAAIVESVVAHKEKETMSYIAAALPKVDPTIASMIDAMLTSAKLPPLTGMIASIQSRDERLDVQGKRLEGLLKERADLERKLAELESRPAVATTTEASHDGVIPAGKIDWVPAHEAFGLAKAKDAFSFKVPVWTWDGVHPHVPAVDKHYVFRPFELMRVLYGIIANKRVYLHGHTGTGKTTLIEQVAARLGYPFMRLNFDSEISRMDLIGRDTLTSEGGTTVSRFVDGILPQMMQSPCIGCFDEIDFVRPDIAYVMQRMLEGDALVITEDGGRVVRPHPMFRAFATGNTVGQGDEHGMYQGARVQSTALLDRFSVWQRIDYLKPEDRDALIKNRVPQLDDALRGKLNRYITEHLEAFTTSKVLQPLSPRGFLGLADALVFFTGVIPNRRDAVQQALESTILDRASVQDRVVLKGLADRVFG